MMNGAILIVPIPVARSYPRTAGNRPLFLARWPAPVTSWKKSDGAIWYSRYRVRLMLPARFPWRLSRSATIAETSGEDRLVPPIPNQPGTGWLPLNVAHTLNGVVSLPEVVPGLMTPRPFWYDGMPQYWLDPPPPAPVAAHQKKRAWLSLAALGA